MKLSLLFAFILTAFLFLTSHAQIVNYQISGRLKDAQGNALGGATLALRNAVDSTLQQTQIAEQDGAFIFARLQPGTYQIKITHIGFKTYQGPVLLLNMAHPSVALPVIILQPSGDQTLKEVLIVSKKRLIEQKSDRTVVNVDAMLSAAGSNALEVLQKSPGVMIDAHDDISLNGKNNILVLIDDKPTYLSAQALAAYLRSLPGGTLDKIELISNPPARYDAAGGAIINIVLKKNQAAGFNGGLSLGYNQGVYARVNHALNANYRSKKINIFSNISYSLDQNFNTQTYNRIFYNADGSVNSVSQQNSQYNYQSNGWNGRIGMDYFLSGSTTIGAIFTANTRPKTDLLNYTNKQYQGSTQLDSVLKGTTSGNYGWRNTGINLNLLHKFDNKGQIFTADLDELSYHSSSTQLSPLAVYRPDGTLESNQQRLFTLPTAIDIYAAKMDYTLPLARKAEFAAGLKSSFVSTDNQSGWFNQAGSNVVPDYSKSNHFHYAENINSAYINLKKEWKRWGVQGGLRAENTVANGHQFSNPAIPDSAFSKNYISLFPSFYLSHHLDSSGNHTLVFSYSQRIRRPSYQQLNPFLFFRDQYSYSAGNPNLAPSFNHIFELKYTYKQYFGLTAGYWWSNNALSTVTNTAGNVFIARPQNFINNRTYSLVPYISVEPTPWWTMHLNAVLLYIMNKGTADGITIDQKTNLHEIETSNELRLGKTWSAELDGFFPGKQAFGQSKSQSIYNISGGIQKTIFKGLGTLHLSMNDLFHTMVSRNQTLAINQVSAFSTGETDTRRIGLSFTYRFGKAANARKRNNTGSAEDEKGRTN